MTEEEYEKLWLEFRKQQTKSYSKLTYSDVAMWFFQKGVEKSL